MRIRLTPFIKYLKLKHTVYLTFSEKEHKEMHAYYEPLHSDMGRLIGHTIKVYLGNPRNRSIETIVAHELIHAWQEEKKLSEIHGRQFARVARRMAARFDLRKVYMPRIDKP